MPEKLQVLDTTLRDGEQTQGVSFTAEEKLGIAQLLLEEAKVDFIEAGSTRVSLGEMQAVKRIAKWAKEKGFLEKVEVLGFVDGKKSVDWATQAGAKRLNLLVKASLNHVEKQLKKTKEQHMQDIKEVVEYAKANEIKVKAALEDWSNGAIDNRQYVSELISLLLKIGVKRAYLCDTLGTLDPSQTKELVQKTVAEFPGMNFEFHAHNDYGMAVANSLAAAKAGAVCIHATVNGLGERAGNASLDEIAVVLNDKTRFGCSVKEKSLAKASKIVETFSGKRIASNKPVTGSSVFTQTAGVHADGDKKAGLYESNLKPERFGRQRQYALGKLSGKASIDQNLERLGLSMKEEDKKRVLKRVIELGDMKKVVTVEDLPYIVSDILGSKEEARIKVLNCAVSSGRGIKPTALLALKMNENLFSESAEGDGGYDAFMNALKKAAGKIGIELPKLTDYEVRIPPGGKTDALVETRISWSIRGKEMTTVGVDPDQVMAAVKATEKMLNAIAKP